MERTKKLVIPIKNMMIGLIALLILLTTLAGWLSDLAGYGLILTPVIYWMIFIGLALSVRFYGLSFNFLAITSFILFVFSIFLYYLVGVSIPEFIMKLAIIFGLLGILVAYFETDEKKAI